MRLETGRTHQIRAHLKAIGHPVVGDPVYGTPGRYGLERQFLHAERLAFDASDHRRAGGRALAAARGSRGGAQGSRRVIHVSATCGTRSSPSGTSAAICASSARRRSSGSSATNDAEAT